MGRVGAALSLAVCLTAVGALKLVTPEFLPTQFCVAPSADGVVRMKAADVELVGYRTGKSVRAEGDTDNEPFETTAEFVAVRLRVTPHGDSMAPDLMFMSRDGKTFTQTGHIRIPEARMMHVGFVTEQDYLFEISREDVAGGSFRLSGPSADGVVPYRPTACLVPPADLAFDGGLLEIGEPEVRVP